MGLKRRRGRLDALAEPSAAFAKLIAETWSEAAGTEQARSLTEEGVTHAQRALRVTLPASYLQLLRVRNGGPVQRTVHPRVNGKVDAIWGVHTGTEASVENRDWSAIRSYMHAHKEASPRLAHMIPFAGDGQYFVCFDYAVGRGREPAIAFVDVDLFVPEVRVADSFREFLEELEQYVDTPPRRARTRVARRPEAEPYVHPSIVRENMLAVRGTKEATRLLAAVLEDPGDDEPRLTYADYLASRQDPQAELIRGQCLLASAHSLTAKQMVDLSRRMETLIAVHGAEWRRATGMVIGRGEFVRGFLERATVDLARLPGAIAASRGAPLSRLDVEVAVNRRSAAADYSVLARLTELPNRVSVGLSGCVSSLHASATDEVVHQVVTFVPRSVVTRIRLGYAMVTHAALRVLLANEALGSSLEEVWINAGEHMGRGTIEVLAGSPLPELRVLQLESFVMHRGVTPLLAAPWRHYLHSLLLRGGGLDDEDAATLARVSLPRAVLVDVSGNPITEAGVAVLARAARDNWNRAMLVLEATE